MAKKFSQFDIAASIAGDESFVGLKDGDNAQFPLADILSYVGGAFWPLSGTAALTDDLDIDGAFDLIFGSITPLTNVAFYINGEFNVDADQVVLRAQDGTDLTELVFDESFFALTTQGVSYVSIDSEVSVGLSVDDGVDSSSLTIGPDSFEIELGVIGVEDAFYFQATKQGSSISAFDSSSEGYSLIFEPDYCYFLDIRSTTKGIEYESDYSAGILSNNRSIPDVGIVNTLISNALGSGGGALTLQTYTVGTLPNAATYQDGLIVVTDESGGRTPAYSDGTNWRRLYDMNIVS